jgi:AraC-like DNA-binding protein
MIKPGPDDKVHPALKLATVIESLMAEGISADDALDGLGISSDEVFSPTTLVSIDQIFKCYRNASKLSRDPHFAYHAGLKFHVTAYGLYGFAILSSVNYRQTMRFAMNYHQLATPVTEIEFREEGGGAIWKVTPISHLRIDGSLYKFLVEHQFGVHLSLHRDVMGSSFAPRELHVTYGPPADASKYGDIFGCPVQFGRAQNEFRYDAAWLDGVPRLGNQITHSAVIGLCDSQLEELHLRIGLAGRVRQVLLSHLMRPTGIEDVAKVLNMSVRTLRRKLSEEGTSFRDLVDELRREMAMKYLRDTDLTVEDIADALGFSDAANFRHAFRRWTNATPQEFRDTSSTAVGAF